MGLNSEGCQRYPVPLLEDIPMVKIASGLEHLVCLSQEGHVYTCGSAEQGQLGRVDQVFSNRGGINYLLNTQPVALGQYLAVADDIWTGFYSTFFRARDTGLIYVFGLNNFNQLGLSDRITVFQPEVSTGFMGRRWKSISGGEHHTLALYQDGNVFCLGRWEYGRLGLGETKEDVKVPTLIPALKNETCIEVNAGPVASFAVTESGVAYSWGGW